MAGEIFQINYENRDILNALRCHPKIEKTVLAKELNIAFKTLNKQLEFLEQSGFISMSPQLEIVKDRFYMCGISVGGSHCKLTLVNAQYKVISAEDMDKLCNKYGVFQQSFFVHRKNTREYGYKYFDTPDNLATLEIYINEIIQDIIRLDDLSRTSGAGELPPIISIGIALTGSIDLKKQIIIRSHNVRYLKNIKKEILLWPDTRYELKKRNIELIIDHNAKAMAVCEKFSLYHSDNKNHEYAGKKNIACFYLGSGISCGLILNNRVIRGARNFSGELGHIQIPRMPEFEGDALPKERCTCGRMYCMEHLLIWDVLGMSRDEFRKITSEEIKEKINELQIHNPEEYQKRMRALGYYVGWAVDLVTKLLNVDLIIFSGKITCFIERAWSYLKPAAGDLDYAQVDCPMILSRYEALAPSVGAAILSTYPSGAMVEWVI